jgi:hypothetical protein
MFSPVVTPDPKALPEPKGAKKSEPTFTEPQLAPGEIGGFVVDRTDVQRVEDWGFKKHHVPFHVRHLWNARLGRCRAWFDVELQSSHGSVEISLPEDYIYQLRLGDWVTVHAFIQDNRYALAKRATVHKVPRKLITMDLDMFWLGPATVCAGEGKIGRGLDSLDRRVFFTWEAYRKYFGARIRKRDREILTEEYEQQTVLGGSYYTVLGLNPPPPPATDDQVKKAYRDKSKETHPDLHPDDPGAGTKFQMVREAYDALQDDDGRASYDMFLSLSQQTFTANKGGADRVRYKQGLHKEGWYPKITSGKMTCSASLIANTILVDSITALTEEITGNKTRICVPVDGLPTVLWGINV